MKNDLDNLIEILNNQSPKALTRGQMFDDTSKFKVIKSKSQKGYWELDIKSLNLVFVFNSRKRFHGIVNWKE